MSGVPELLRRFRAESGLTQEQLAESSGLSVEAIRTLEIGRRRYPRALTVSRLADALELTTEDRDELEQAARRPTETQDRLPAGVTDFVGRAESVQTLTDLLLRTREPARPTSVVISAVTGMGGVGKTTLAIHVGHLVEAQFPDGRIYLNLRGETEPVPPLQALTSLLRTLGVPAQEIPDELAAAAARYRTALAGRRVLVVLDDAANAEQVTPLIPGTSGSAAVITSRRLLDQLAGALHLRLDVLSDDEALHLLGEVIGAALIAAEPEAALAVVHACGNLPLALRIAGGRLPSGRPVQELADRLADASTRLGELANQETGVRASIALSIDDLRSVPADRDAAEAFGVLALLDPGEFSLRVAAAALGRTVDETEELLDRLVDVHLLEAPTLHRYRLHDLVRAVGREGARAEDQRRIEERVLNCYLAMLWRADELAGEAPMSAAWRDPSWAEPARDLTELTDVLDWLDADRSALVDLVRRAARGTESDRQLAVRIAVGMNVFGPSRLRWLEWRDVNRAAAEVVDLRSDPVGAALVHFDLGLALGELNDFSAAADQLALATDAARLIGQQEFLISSLVNLAHMLEQADRVPEGFGYVREALDLIDRVPEAAGQGSWAQLTLGMLHGRAGESALQVESFERAIALVQDNPDVLCRMHISAGASLRECGQAALAIDVLLAGVDVIREHDTRGVLAEALCELGAAYGDLDRHPEALAAYLEGLGIAVSRELWDREARIRTGLGQTYLELGRDADGKEQLQLAEAVYAAHGTTAPS
ncbi:NB-ARC domain-containing protein [Kribbella sp. NPDC005582]|uniref:NB-ARC domain-containing protein n=1 Tax=Kribbella sp. NPDC005582 TaxID=3156893 RepID=UPI0033BBD076